MLINNQKKCFITSGYSKRKFKLNRLAYLISGAFMLSANHAISFERSTIQIEPDNLVASDFCGKPADLSEPGFYLWQDCELEAPWNQRMFHGAIVTGETIDGTNNPKSYSGRLSSEWQVFNRNIPNTSSLSAYVQANRVKGISFDISAGDTNTYYFDFSANQTPNFTLQFDAAVTNEMIPDLFVGNKSKLLTVSQSQDILFYQPKAITQSDFEALGIINVTLLDEAPENRDGDYTAALQAAISRGIEEGKMVYLPSGEYKVSETLHAMMPVSPVEYDGDPNTTEWYQDRRKPLSMMGSTIGDGRPVLKLTNGAIGFNNSNNPQPLLWVWAQCRDGKTTDQQCLGGVAGNTAPAEHEQSNINFSQAIRGVDIDITNHTGAIGIRHAGSQGSSVSDMKIKAQGAFAGMDEIPGQGGGVYNVEINGGKYGIRTSQNTRYPQIAGMVLSNQEEAALLVNLQSPLVAAGIEITGNPNSAIKILQGINNRDQSGAVSLIDARVDIGSNSLLINNGITNDKNLFLKNVFVRGGASNLISLSNGTDSRLLSENNGAWKYINEYSYTTTDSQGYVWRKDTAEDHNNLIVSREYLLSDPGDFSPTEALLLNHVWDDRLFPTFEHSDVVIATNAYPDDISKNLIDGEQDATNKLQNMLDDKGKVFLPKGTYNLTGSITLGAHDALLGLGKTYSVLQQNNDWVGGSIGEPLVKTANDADATTILDSVFLNRVNANGGASFVHWQAGSQSIYRDNFFGMNGNAAFTLSSPLSGSAILIDQNGGGRWYGAAGEWNRFQAFTETSDYRGLKINGTVQPSQFYGLNVERVQSDVQSEIKNSKNVTIYYLKGESFVKTFQNGKYKFVKGAGPNNLNINNSKSTKIYAFGGNSRPADSQIKLSNTYSYLVTNMGGTITDSSTYKAVFDATNDFTILGKEAGSIFKLGKPDETD